MSSRSGSFWIGLLLVGVVLGALVGCRAQSGEPFTRGEAQVASIRFVFTEGFDKDTVVIRIDGKEVRQHGPISTRHDVEPPLAWSVDVPVDRDVVSVEVLVPAKGASETTQLNVKQFPQLDVAVAGNRLVLRGSQLVPSIG
jgi:hypothetical protein